MSKTINYEIQEELVINRHAYIRMKERNGWGKKAASRMAPKIYTEGLRPEQVKGHLKGWIKRNMSMETKVMSMCCSVKCYTFLMGEPC